MLLGELDELLVRHASSSDKYHPIGGVVSLYVADQMIPFDALDFLLGTENSAGKRLSLESGGMEMVEDNFLELLVDLLLFSEDDVAFAFDGLRF